MREALAAARRLSRLEAGVNMSRHEAYRKLLERGFRTDIQGVAMHRAMSRVTTAEVYLIDDWRWGEACCRRRIGIPS